MKCCLVQVECYAEHETLGEDKKAFIHVIEILGGPSQNINILRYLVDSDIHPCFVRMQIYDVEGVKE